MLSRRALAIGLLVVYMLSAWVFLEIPLLTDQVSQKSIHVYGIYILTGVLFFEALIKGKCVRGNRFDILVLMCGFLMVWIAIYDTAIYGKPITNYIGMIVNLYVFVFIYKWCQFSVDREIVVEALAVTAMVSMCVSFWIMILVNRTNSTIYEAQCADHLIVAVVGLLIIPHYKRLKYRNFVVPTMFIITLWGGMGVGSRSIFGLCCMVGLGYLCVLLIKRRYRLALLATSISMGLFVGVWSMVSYVSIHPHLELRIVRALSICNLLIRTDDVDIANRRSFRIGEHIGLGEMLENAKESSGRSDAYKEIVNSKAFEKLNGRLAFGTGDRVVYDEDDNIMYIHNVAIQLLYTFGIAGVIAYTLCIAFSFFITYKSGEDKWMKLSYIVTVLCILVYAMVEPVLSGGPFPNVYMWMLFSLVTDEV